MKNLARLPCFVVLSNSLCLAFTPNIHHDLGRIHISSQNFGSPHLPLHYCARPTSCRWKGAVVSAKSLDDEPSSDIAASSSTITTLFSLSMLVIPVASLIFPQLLQSVRSLPPNSSEQLTAVTILFVSNRVYLYAMAATIVGLAACRGSTDAPQLGRRITDLTEELLYRPTLLQKHDDNKSSTTPEGKAIVDPLSEKPLLIQSLAGSGLEQRLDQVSTETQALLLPLLVSFLLALSIFLLPFWSGAPSFVTDNGQGSAVQDILSKVLPAITQIWNVALLVIFTRSEVRRLGFELKWIPDSTAFEWLVAVVITGLACFAQIWPSQNFVNMALAILVSRAIQLDSFAAVVGALSLLTLYDATSVFLIPAAGAYEILGVPHHHDAAALASSSLELASTAQASGSAMGSVAMQKLTSTTFAPGILTVKIGNSLGGALGLGDAVFPSLMASFAKRFDDSHSTTTKGKTSMFAVCMIGYLLGCLACEFAPLISTSGLPALLFIIPFMLGSIFLGSAMSGQLQDLIAYNPKDNST